jgi:hypothetical protein
VALGGTMQAVDMISHNGDIKGHHLKDDERTLCGKKVWTQQRFTGANGL